MKLKVKPKANRKIGGRKLSRLAFGFVPCEPCMFGVLIW
jgi:hypothetical protein